MPHLEGKMLVREREQKGGAAACLAPVLRGKGREKEAGAGWGEQPCSGREERPSAAQHNAEEGGGPGRSTESRQWWRRTAVGTGDGWGTDRRARGYSTPV
jgi:hypothetical protein